MALFFALAKKNAETMFAQTGSVKRALKQIQGTVKNRKVLASYCFSSCATVFSEFMLQTAQNTSYRKSILSTKFQFSLYICNIIEVRKQQFEKLFKHQFHCTTCFFISSTGLKFGIRNLKISKICVRILKMVFSSFLRSI